MLLLRKGHRNSDDFNLKYDDRHPDFIQFNIYQTILTSHLSLTPDCDMFASNPPDHWPTYQALLRCLSPGPLLLSDTPDTKTDKTLLAKMTAKNRSGRLKAVKTDTPAQALPSRWFWDNLQGDQDGPAMLAFVRVPVAHGAIIGAWNCRKTSTSSRAIDKIRTEDVEDALEVDQVDEEYALFSFGHSERNSERVAMVKPGSEVDFPLDLAEAECEVVVIAKVWKVNERKLAVLGSLDKFTTLAGIEVEVREGELVISSCGVWLKREVGILLIRTRYASERLSVLVFGEQKPDVSFSVDGKPVLSASRVEIKREAWLCGIAIVADEDTTSGLDIWTITVHLD